MPKQFHHEKLEVFQVSIRFVSWVGDLLEGPLANCSQSAVRQLERASTSIPLNIAEGNGKRSAKDRARFLDSARGSALESAACLEVLVARRKVSQDRVLPGKEMLVRVVEMLSKLIQRVLELEDTSMLGRRRT